MLQIPFKTSAPCDLVSPLLQHLSTEYSANIADESLADLQKLQLMRNGATGVSAASEEGLHLLLTYQAQLMQVSRRLVLPPESAQLSFAWNDAFIKGKVAEQHGFPFERSAILFNCGAVESALGAAQDRSAEGGLKKACKAFQNAAGYFGVCKALLPELAGKGAVTPDSTLQGLGLAAALMLAQAQACYYEMAVRKRAETGVKPSLLAKLAQQGADWFKVAKDAAHGPGLDGQLDASWPAHVTFQCHSFGAAAQYWQALHVREAALAKGQGYAEEITRVKAAQAEATAALAVATAQGMGAQQTGSVTDLQSKLASMLTTALADNRTIYLEVEPELESLPPVKGASPVKPTQPSLDIPAGAGDPLLATLLPGAAMRALEATREKLATSASVVEAEAKQAAKDARAQLAAVGLPGSIAAQDEGSGFPEAVWQRVAEVQACGGEWALAQKVAELDQGASRACDLLDQVERKLEDEYNAHAAFVAKHGQDGGSSNASDGFKSDVAHYRGLLKRAEESDAGLKALVSSLKFKDSMAQLSKSRQQLDGLLPRRDLLDDAATVKSQTADAGPLSRELMSLAAHLKARDNLVRDLDETLAAQQANLLPAIQAMANAGTPLSVSLPGGGTGTASEHLTSCLAGAETAVQAKATAVNKSVEDQAALLASVLEANRAFDAARLKDAVTLGRQKVVQDVNAAATEFHDAHAQLTDGASFYGDLVGRLLQLVQTAEGAFYASNLRRRDLELSFGSSHVRASREASDAALAQRLAQELQMDGPNGFSDSNTGGHSSGSSSRLDPPLSPPPYDLPSLPTYSQSSSAPPPPPISSVSARTSTASVSTVDAPPPFYASAVATAAPVSPPYAAAAADPAAISRLADMGFPKADAAKALEASGGNEEAALNQLLESS